MPPSPLRSRPCADLTLRPVAVVFVVTDDETSGRRLDGVTWPHVFRQIDASQFPAVCVELRQLFQVPGRHQKSRRCHRQCVRCECDGRKVRRPQFYLVVVCRQSEETQSIQRANSVQLAGDYTGDDIAQFAVAYVCMQCDAAQAFTRYGVEPEDRCGQRRATGSHRSRLHAAYKHRHAGARDNYFPPRG